MSFYVPLTKKQVFTLVDDYCESAYSTEELMELVTRVLRNAEKWQGDEMAVVWESVAKRVNKTATKFEKERLLGYE